MEMKIQSTQKKQREEKRKRSQAHIHAHTYRQHKHTLKNSETTRSVFSKLKNQVD